MSSKSTKASLRQATSSSGTAVEKVSDKVESDSKKSKEKGNQGLPAKTASKAPLEENNGAEPEENLLKTPLTYSLCTRLVEEADYQQEEVPIMLDLAGGVIVEGHLKKGSRASSLCSMVSATGCKTSHMMITGLDRSMREVDKSKPTTRSECGNMHIVQG